MSILKQLTLAAVAAVAVFCAPSSAKAAFVMTITVLDANTNTVIASETINDNNTPAGTATDLSPAVGRIIFDGSIGGFDIQTSTGTSNAPGTPTLAQLTINNLSIDSDGLAVGDNRTVVITLSDTGFTSPLGAATVESQLSTTQLPTGTTVDFVSQLNGVDLSPLGLGTVGGTRVTDQVTIGTNPFTLANVTTFTVLGQGLNTGLTIQTTGLTAVAVPAPAGLLLALTGLPALGFGYMLRRRKA